MRVAVVAVVDIAEHILIDGVLTLGNQFVVAASGTYLGRGGEEELELGIGENDSSDVATVHDDTFVATHLLLLGNKEMAHFGYRRDA